MTQTKQAGPGQPKKGRVGIHLTLNKKMRTKLKELADDTGFKQSDILDILIQRAHPGNMPKKGHIMEAYLGMFAAIALIYWWCFGRDGR